MRTFFQHVVYGETPTRGELDTVRTRSRFSGVLSGAALSGDIRSAGAARSGYGQATQSGQTSAPAKAGVTRVSPDTGRDRLSDPLPEGGDARGSAIEPVSCAAPP